MKREIKFRAWHKPIIDKETGITLEGHMDYELAHQKLINIKTETSQIPAEFGFQHVQHGLYFINQDLAAYGDRLMQYTGLKDKNGKEIYEGDIVNIIDNSVPYHMEVKWVTFEDNEFGYGIGIGWNIHPDEKKEVIGNIYHNPELLK